MQRIKDLYAQSDKGGASSTLPFIPSRDVAELMVRGDLIIDITSGIVIGLLKALDELHEMPAARNSPANWCFNPASPLIAARREGAQALQPGAAPIRTPLVALIAADIEQCDLITDEALSFLRKIATDHRRARQWLLKLTAIHQVKPLKPANITNFFAQFGTSGVVGAKVDPYIRYSASKLPRIFDDAGMRNKMITTTFDMYHTSYSSSAGLGMTMLRSLEDVALNFLNDDEIRSICESFRKPWNKERASAIPTRTLAVIYCYHTASKTLPSNWYQGDRAVSLIPAALQKALVKAFDSVIKAMSGVDQIRDSSILTEVLDSVPVQIRRPVNRRRLPKLPAQADIGGSGHDGEGSGAGTEDSQGSSSAGSDSETSQDGDDLDQVNEAWNEIIADVPRERGALVDLEPVRIQAAVARENPDAAIAAQPPAGVAAARRRNEAARIAQAARVNQVIDAAPLPRIFDMPGLIPWRGFGQAAGEGDFGQQVRIGPAADHDVMDAGDIENADD